MNGIRARLLTMVVLLSAIRIVFDTVRRRFANVTGFTETGGAVRLGPTQLTMSLTGPKPYAAEEKPLPKDKPDTPRQRIRDLHNTVRESGHRINMDEIDGPLDYLKELINRFNSDECASWAASLSFFAILSIAPILLCGLAILGFFIHDPQEASHQVYRIVMNVLPDRASAKLLISQFNIEQSAATLKHSAPRAAVIGILSLIWASLQIFVNAVAPMNAAYRAKESRNWFKLRLCAFVLLVATGFLFLLSLLPTAGIGLFNRLDLGHLPDPPAPLIATLLFFLSLVINAVMFTVIYRYLPSPSAKTTLHSAAVAGSVIAILWELAKMAFGFYLAHFANYNKIYGSLGGLIALILWIYYSSMILLLGAEIAKLYQDSREAAATGTVAG